MNIFLDIAVQIGIFFIILSILLHTFIIFIVKKSIEKKYKRKLYFDPNFYYYRYFGGNKKISNLVKYILLSYLDERNFLKNKQYLNNLNPLLKLKYKAKNESLINIIICFSYFISILLTALIFLSLFIIAIIQINFK